MSKHSKTLISIVLSTLLFLGCLPGRASALTQSDIDTARAQRDAIRAERQEKQALVDSLAEQQADVVQQKAAMDERNAAMLRQINATEEEIRVWEDMISQKITEIAAAKALEDEQLARYRVRVRAMEEEGRHSLLGVLLSTADLREFLTVMDDVGEIMRHDRALEDAYIASRRHTEELRAEYEKALGEQQQRHSDLLNEQRELQAGIDEAEAMIASLQSDIDNRRAEADAVLAAEYAADAELQRLALELERQRREEEERRRREEEARQEAARRAEEARHQEEEAARREEEARQEAAAPVTGTGSFVWPVPGHSYVTSRFGLRVHPITGVKKSHTGIDIPADRGTPVVAADSGFVTKAAMYSGYGNCVMLDHGNGYLTLYGHLSSFAVSEGESVSQGQTIGYVGSTGISTGPHCHFEIWSGGSRIDPEPFFSGLSFSPSAGE